MGHVLMARPVHHETKAPIVQWQNTSMVRMRLKFDSWLEHHTPINLK